MRLLHVLLPALGLGAAPGCSYFPTQSSPIEWCDDLPSERVCYMTLSSTFFLDFPAGTICFRLTDQEMGERVLDYQVSIENFACRHSLDYQYTATDFDAKAAYDQISGQDREQIPPTNWLFHPGQNNLSTFPADGFWGMKNQEAANAFMYHDEQFLVGPTGNKCNDWGCGWFPCDFAPCNYNQSCDCAFIRRIYVKTRGDKDLATVFKVGVPTCEVLVKVAGSEDGTEDRFTWVSNAETRNIKGLKITATNLGLPAGIDFGDEHVIRYDGKYYRAKANDIGSVDDWQKVGALQMKADKSQKKIDWSKWVRSQSRDYTAAVSIGIPKYNMRDILSRHPVIPSTSPDADRLDKSQGHAHRNASWIVHDHLYAYPNSMSGMLQIDSVGHFKLTMGKSAVCPEVIDAEPVGEFNSPNGAEVIVTVRGTCGGGNVLLQLSSEDLTLEAKPVAVDVPSDGKTIAVNIPATSYVKDPVVIVKATSWDAETELEVEMEFDDNSFDLGASVDNEYVTVPNPNLVPDEGPSLGEKLGGFFSGLGDLLAKLNPFALIGGIIGVVLTILAVFLVWKFLMPYLAARRAAKKAVERSGSRSSS